MAQRNRGNPWGQGSQGGGKQAKSTKKNSPLSPPPPVKSAEERFRQAQAKLQESVQKHLDQELELSSEEEDLETDNIYDSVIKNYSQIGGKNEDLGKTQNFLENIFRSDVAICLICIATIKRADKIWSCGSCYGFFHLLCIQRWGKDSIAHQKLADDERISPTKKEYHWPCPKCRKNYTPESIPQRYECFCRQVIDPTYQPWLVPHSCGQVCGKDLVPSCGHSCLLLCHPGPCPPCPKMVRAKCFCSNGGEKMVRCCHKEWSCGQKCSKKLACQKHKCETVCHPGECPACPKTSMISCDCKSQSRMTACAELSWKCEKVCGKSLDCGKHTCELVCHKGDCGPCPRTLPRACPCGAEENILPCTQEVATCGSTCGKLLDCGLHPCNQRCHRGSCGACMEFLEKYCRCGLHKKEIACIKEYLCDTKCKGIRDCGVHPCNRKCCDGRCPPCEKICGKTLRCGQHKCASVCHRGPCYPCEQTKQISCRCGSTVITVPCGTHKRKKNLKCNKLCLIPPDCHHEKREEHKCHMGPCPPCRQTCCKPRDCGHPCSLSCHSSVVVSAVPNYKPSTPWDRVYPALTEIKELQCLSCEEPVCVQCQGNTEENLLPPSPCSEIVDCMSSVDALSHKALGIILEEPEPSDSETYSSSSSGQTSPICFLEDTAPPLEGPAPLLPAVVESLKRYSEWLKGQGLSPYEALMQEFIYIDLSRQGLIPPEGEQYSYIKRWLTTPMERFPPEKSAQPTDCTLSSVDELQDVRIGVAHGGLTPQPSGLQKTSVGSEQEGLNSPKENGGESKMKMSGSRRKRYQHFIRLGLEHEEAVKASEKTLSADPHLERKKQPGSAGTPPNNKKTVERIFPPEKKAQSPNVKPPDCSGSSVELQAIEIGVPHTDSSSRPSGLHGLSEGSAERRPDSPKEIQVEPVKMCGSRKKRYLHFIRLGFEHAEALRASENRMAEGPTQERKKQPSSTGTYSNNRKIGERIFPPELTVHPPNKEAKRPDCTMSSVDELRGASIGTVHADPSPGQSGLQNTSAGSEEITVQPPNEEAKPPGCTMSSVDEVHEARIEAAHADPTPGQSGLQNTSAGSVEITVLPQNEEAKPPGCTMSSVDELQRARIEPAHADPTRGQFGLQDTSAGSAEITVQPSNEEPKPADCTKSSVDELQGVSIGAARAHPTPGQSGLQNKSVDSEDKEPDPPKESKWPVKMSGSRRKRYRRFISLGLGHEEALIASELTQPGDPSQAPKKQPSSAGASSNQKSVERSYPSEKNTQPPDEEAKPAACTASSVDNLQGVRIGIARADYPRTFLSNREVEIVQEGILQSILDTPMEDDSPGFFGITYKKGWFLLHCRDQLTVDWLRRQLVDTPLQIMQGNQIPGDHIAIGYFPDSVKDSEERILLLLMRQNTGLNTDHWRIINRNDEGKITILTMMVDDASASTIKANSKFYYKFGTMKLRLKKSKEAQP